MRLWTGTERNVTISFFGRLVFLVVVSATHPVFFFPYIGLILETYLL